jgi:hypothetical protein
MSSLFLLAFVTSINAVGRIVLHCVAGAYLQKAGILHKAREGIPTGGSRRFILRLQTVRILDLFINAR